MIVHDFLSNASQQLEAAGIPSARLDVLILMEDALKRDRASILAHPELDITPVQEAALNTKLGWRAEHVPLAYLRGHSDFYGRSYDVDESVLVPRPETEVLIDLLKTMSLPTKPRILDIGSGSGCIGITAALELPKSHVLLCDVDPKTLTIARRNARSHSVHNVTFAESNLLESIDGAFDVMLANLPYVPVDHPINSAAKHEPKLALFAGTDGLVLYRLLWEQIAALTTKPTFVLTESFIEQHHMLKDMAKAAGYHPTTTKGLIQAFSLPKV